MKLAMAVFTLPLVLALSGLGPVDDGFARERKPENAAAKDALEGQAPPALSVEQWRLPAGMDKAFDWNLLRGKVVLIDFWGTW